MNVDWKLPNYSDNIDLFCISLFRFKQNKFRRVLRIYLYNIYSIIFENKNVDKKKKNTGK